jgi:hypothetical protein
MEGIDTGEDLHTIRLVSFDLALHNLWLCSARMSGEAQQAASGGMYSRLSTSSRRGIALCRREPDSGVHRQTPRKVQVLTGAVKI